MFWNGGGGRNPTFGSRIFRVACGLGVKFTHTLIFRSRSQATYDYLWEYVPGCECVTAGDHNKGDCIDQTLALAVHDALLRVGLLEWCVVEGDEGSALGQLFWSQ